MDRKILLRSPWTDTGRRIPRIALLSMVGAFAVGCGLLPPTSDDDSAPWKDGASVEVVTAAPDAGGPLSSRNCPTLAEARAAVPMLTTGPDANAVPFKTMVLQCAYSMDERDVQGRPASIGILVFDASAEGRHLWDTVRTDPAFPDAVDLPGVADVAFATGSAGHNDVWVVSGRFGFHLMHTRQDGIPLDQLVGLSRAMLTGLARPPR